MVVVAISLPEHSLRAEQALDTPKAEEKEGLLDGLSLEPEQRKELEEFLEARQFAAGGDRLGGAGYGKKRRSILEDLSKDLDRSRRMCRILARARLGRDEADAAEEHDSQSRHVPCETVEAIAFLARSRDPCAVDVLLPLVGMPFFSMQSADNARPVGGRLADDALISIGLPAADRILQLVGEGKIRGPRAVAARNVALRILAAR